jgi:hypothetical protein
MPLHRGTILDATALIEICQEYGIAYTTRTLRLLTEMV